MTKTMPETAARGEEEAADAYGVGDHAPEGGAEGHAGAADAHQGAHLASALLAADHVDGGEFASEHPDALAHAEGELRGGNDGEAGGVGGGESAERGEQRAADHRGFDAEAVDHGARRDEGDHASEELNGEHLRGKRSRHVVGVADEGQRRNDHPLPQSHEYGGEVEE